MKEALTIILLILLSFNFIGVGMVYDIWLYTIKLDAEEQLEYIEEEDDLVLLKVPKKRLNDPSYKFYWIDEREFEYRGERFDISYQEDHGDAFWYYCRRDAAETELLSTISEYVSTYLYQHSGKQKNVLPIKAYLDKLFLATLAGNISIPVLNPLPYPTKQSSMPSIFLDVESPPPQK